MTHHWIVLAALALVSLAPASAQERHSVRNGSLVLEASPQARPAPAPLVELYTLADCSACWDAKRWLYRANVPFTERSVGTPEKYAAARIRGVVGVPHIFTPAGDAAGFDPGTYDKLTR